MPHVGAAAWTVRGLRRALASGPDWFVGCIAREAEARRLFPWIPVAYGAGIALAFAADGPLSAWPPLLVGGAFAGAATIVRARPVPLAVAIGLAAMFLGFAAAVIRTHAVAGPVLARVVSSPFEGFVETIEERQAGGRLVIRLARLDRVEAADRPVRIRATARVLEGVAPGDYVAGTARLLPPPEAARPGGYDFTRDDISAGSAQSAPSRASCAGSSLPRSRGR